MCLDSISYLGYVFLYNYTNTARVKPTRTKLISGVLAIQDTPENVWSIRRQNSVSVDEVLDGTHGHDNEVRRRVGVVAGQKERSE